VHIITIFVDFEELVLDCYRIDVATLKTSVVHRLFFIRPWSAVGCN